LSDEYERPFKEYWLDQRPLAVLENEDLAIISGIDYTRFKLFHLSLLFRSGISTKPEFSETVLGPRHESKLRTMILERAAGSSTDHPIMCLANRRPDNGHVWWDLIASPNPGGCDGVRFHQFTSAFRRFYPGRRPSRSEQSRSEASPTQPAQEHACLVSSPGLHPPSWERA
jgi:hypothetical protein